MNTNIYLAARMFTRAKELGLETSSTEVCLIVLATALIAIVHGHHGFRQLAVV